MRIKVIGFFLLAIAVSIGVAGFRQSRTSVAVAENAQQAAPSQGQSQAEQDQPGTINGKEHPELIPDYVAYAMLFRVIANRPEESAQRSIRTYVKQIFQCSQCNNPPGASSDGDIDALLAVAEEHHRRISVLDTQAAKIKGRSWPEPAPEVLAKLTQLQAQNDALTADIASSLPAHLSGRGMENLQRYIVEHVKPAIKIVPGPQPPADSKYYQEPPPAGAAPPATHHHQQ